MKLNPEIGRKYGRLKVTRILPRINGQLTVEAICDCGTMKAFSFSNLNRGVTQSCGCYHKQRCIEALTTHGLAHKRRAYGSWTRMRRRCLSRKSPDWENYGGRGITISPLWKDDFARFFADMGEPPSREHSIDRINNDGNYEPGNCRWATHQQQARNRRITRPVGAKGESMWICDWAEKLGVGRATIRRRIKLFGSPYGNPNWQEGCKGMPILPQQLEQEQRLRNA